MTYREEIIGHCRLILGDAREIAPAINGIDSIITDPVWPNAPEGMFDVDDPKALLRDTLKRARAKRLAIVVRHDSDARFLTAVPKRFPYFRTSFLPYVIPERYGRTLGGMEVVYAFGAPVSSARGRHLVPGIGPSSQPGENRGVDHPCPRAPSHMRWLVNWYSDHGDTVLDPFMGSATIGEACVRLGRSYVGIEIDAKHFDVACWRIEEAHRQPDMFIASSKREPSHQIDMLETAP